MTITNAFSQISLPPTLLKLVEVRLRASASMPSAVLAPISCTNKYTHTHFPWCSYMPGSANLHASMHTWHAFSWCAPSLHRNGTRARSHTSGTCHKFLKWGQQFHKVGQEPHNWGMPKVSEVRLQGLISLYAWLGALRKLDFASCTRLLALTSCPGFVFSSLFYTDFLH